MNRAGASARHQAAALRKQARGGPLRRLLARLGVDTIDHRLMNQADRWDHGAAAEEATALLLDGLRPYGWCIRHDLRLPPRRPGGTSKANLDHVLVSPCGTAVVVLDTKAWHRGRTAQLVRGRVRCGHDERHDEVEKVADYARRVRTALLMPGVRVLPMLVVHGSPVVGGHLEARVDGWPEVVHVLGPDWLVPTLAWAPQGADTGRAFRVAVRVEQVLQPYR